MTTILEINETIMFGDLTNEQLNSIVSAIKVRRTELVKQARRSLTLGDNVKFYSHDKHMYIVGNVTKIGRKYITLDTPKTKWRVPANLLEAA
jgi:hypothetical protein